MLAMEIQRNNSKQQSVLFDGRDAQKAVVNFPKSRHTQTIWWAKNVIVHIFLTNLTGQSRSCLARSKWVTTIGSLARSPLCRFISIKVYEFIPRIHIDNCFSSCDQFKS